MCGIAGFISEGKYNLRDLKRMLCIQSHRGPDYTGVWNSGEIFLGHNRLSIIDITTAGNQPMVFENGRYVLAFNGEIYNYKELRAQISKRYRFKSNSDTEVLLYMLIEYGVDALSMLDGMFSIAFWDNEKEELLMVRDRFGVKPLYYHLSDDGLILASEIKAIHEVINCRLPELSTWASYYTKGLYGTENDTFWKGIKTIKAGHYLLYSKGKCVEKEWYSFHERTMELMNSNQFINRSDQEHIDFYGELLERSINRRFRADVPVGFNLSGGLDSSVLLGSIHRLFKASNDIRAFTFFCNDDRFDELKWVREMNQNTNKPLYEVMLLAKDVPQLVDKVSYYQDEPYGGIPTLAYYLVFKQARERGTKVLLDGQGMDEQWAGYDYFHNSLGHVIQGSKSDPLKSALLSQEFKVNSSVPDYPKPFDSDLLNLQYRDLFFTKLPRALKFNDRISMANSTELREPFLNFEMVEYAFSLPVHLKVRDGHAKWGLRQIGLKLFENSIALAPKRAVQTPQVEWLKGDLKDFVMASIEGLLRKKPEWFDKPNVDVEVDAFMKGKYDNSFFIWQLINTNTLF
ncbi:hypothetical protein OB69_08235 [Roseivirga seohaensis subsp. aquiponti]|uniref:asparagine synthase (glutamine-hydrolyzing) n=2 Tax=Roseivirga TaxID=290180 RepID=A0A0L8ALS8_9BACT|nr:asparagine synthase (glutamine-hydrolyzing) [Roseivirga seohaensis]KOF03274.1 hypothetical protein OB69_08235 [Roseivirga seohaensis subsp. aquiponti]|tara:strand:- start:121041 stop:122756 length:1716 start_codon:yes stop_codon:yes gene_type:complete